MNEQAWLVLFAAGILETSWAVGLKFSEGFTRPWASGATIILMVGSFYLLSRSLNTLPLGTAYAVWTGIGAVGATIAGIVLFGESGTLHRVFSILLIVAGIIGLHLTTVD